MSLAYDESTTWTDVRTMRHEYARGIEAMWPAIYALQQAGVVRDGDPRVLAAVCVSQIIASADVSDICEREKP